MKMRKILSAFTAAALLSSTVPAVAFGASADAINAEESVLSAQTAAAAADEQAVTAQAAEEGAAAVEAAATYPYQDQSLSFEERAADLVARMTLEEKAAQTSRSAPGISRLGVSKYNYWREGIHGVARQGVATSFPSSLSMSNTWNRQLMYEIMDITSTEARGKNNKYDLNYWNPTINLARDPRWGRNEESYGEDPYLTGEIGGYAIKGMQGTDEKYIKTMATLKHYAANNCEGERQRGTSVMNERTMREYYSRAFRDISRNFDPAAVMSSYNGTTIYRNGEILSAMDGQKIDYIASSANSYLLNDLLKRTYGFGGFVVGDCGAWGNVFGEQPLRKKLYPDTPLDNITAPMTVSKIIAAGSSLDCGGDGSAQVAEAVKQGLISEDALDIVVYELFLQRMRTGEFDTNVEYQNIKPDVIETDEHVRKAEEAAEETWVLLKNNGTLPLRGKEVTDTDSPYSVTKAAFTDDNTLSVSYTKKDGAPSNATLLAATYSGKDAMLECRSVSVDGSGDQTIGISRPIVGSTKVFIWENSSTIKPLSLTKTVGEPAATEPINVAVVGSQAADAYLGDYSGEPTKVTTNIDGITAAVKNVNPKSTVDLIGNISDKTPLFNIKSITLVKSTGKNKTLDLSTATKVNGMTKDGSTLKDITKAGVACIPSVDFKDVTDIQIEAASLPGMPSVNVSVCYESLSQNAATVQIQSTGSSNEYKTNTAVYEGATGGYTSTADMYIRVNASADFSVDNYKDSLDKADYIIAYGGTTKADSGESNDRKSIDLPASESHVQQICDVYPDKTIVVLSTVGQVNVENFKDKCAAMLWTSYNGQTQGEALGKVLTGVVNPSGKLSTTWYTQADLEKMPLGSARKSEGGINYNYTNYELSQDINNPTAEWPGRTYQYYTGTPVYPFGYGTSYTTYEYSNIGIDKTNADANDIVTITADIKNTGAVRGAETAQLYITVPGADGKKLPLKQLKGFEKVELEPGETKKVSFKLDISDVYFFDEAKQQNYVVSGEYTAKVGANADDPNALSVKFNVSGDIADTVRDVYTIPSGLKVYGAKDSSGAVVPAIDVDAGASVTMKNDKVITDFAANGISVTYRSADTSVATVDQSGIVKAGTKEGVTSITVTASKGGSTASATFPIVTQFKNKISDDVKAGYIKQLDEAYAKCPQIAYTADNWNTLNSIYNEAHDTVSAALLDDGLSLLVSQAVDEMLAVPKIELAEEYTVGSVNPEIIKDNRIEYSAGGIGEITATETTITGSVTADSPAEIDMQALSGGTKITSGLIWSIERLDSSSRKNADIDIDTGKIKLYENGVYKITASDYPNKKCGSITVYANLQIEGESADEANGAKLDDEKGGASGGLCAGSTEAKWLRFDGVKLSRLKDITFRVSQKDAESTINVSLQPNTDWIIATAKAPVTGDWSKWTEVKADVNRSDLNWLSLDENGCGTIYVQTNKANLDYIMLGYNNDDIDAYCLPNGRIAVNTSAQSGKLTAMVGGAEKASADITGTGTIILGGFAENDAVTLSVTDGSSKNITYNAAQPKSMLVYNFSDAVFDTFFDSAGGAKLTSGLGMDGDGGWNTTTKSVSYKYGDRTYKFTRALKGGKGEPGERRVYFTPDSDGAVTAFFNASADRCMYIEQGSAKAEKFGTGSMCTVQLNVKAGEPVYVYGGGANKDLYGVVFEANKEVVQATPEPTATPKPTQAPLPDTDYTNTVEFEDFESNWVSSANIGSNAKASGGKMVENTKNDDIFYFGQSELDNLLVITLNAGMRGNSGDGVAVAEVYAVDMTGVNITSTTAKSDVNKLLTAANKIGETEIQGTSGDWNNYLDNNIILSTAMTGTKGIFVKVKATQGGKYCGNYDYIALKYNMGGAAASASVEAAALTAENNIAAVSIAGDEITAVDKYDGTVSKISYNDAYGTNVVFNKLINANGMLTALVTDEDTGETGLITSPAGTVWMNITPTEFAENDTGSTDYIINDVLSIDDQMYLACDGGILITMPPCTKCVTLKKVCDFDIKELDCTDNDLILTGGNQCKYISLNDVRQTNIKKDAAEELIEDGARLVDVRSAEEFATGSIDGAVNVPVDEFGTWIDGVSADETIIVFCGSGARAEKAVDIAEEQGFTGIYNAGGINNLK